ncbi:transfer/carrier protein [Lithospermum erythrorhizon]|uniref:Transfer/carrier protein n=1 Tax=Lithospermum erythrorhizon TaxID=34254 RepID=A0AAV3QZN6_LITER
MNMKRKRGLEMMGSEIIRSLVEELSIIKVVKAIKSEEDSILDDDGDEAMQKISYFPLRPFLAICNLVTQVLDKIGPTMAVMRQDIHQNIQRLEKFCETNPVVYSNVVEILKRETSQGKAKKGPTCSKSFVWLTRSLDFSVELLKLLEENLERNMEQAVEESYNITLKPWHGWISAAAYKVAMKLVPDNRSLVDALMPTYEKDNDMLKEELHLLMSLFSPELEEIHTILRCYQLDKLKSI